MEVDFQLPCDWLKPVLVRDCPLFFRKTVSLRLQGICAPTGGGICELLEMIGTSGLTGYWLDTAFKTVQEV